MTMKLLFALATLAVIATPAAAAEQQPTGKWCETESTDDNLAPDIWQTFKRGNCKTGDDESGWIEFFSGGYRERDTICKMTNERRGKNWLLYHCLVETEFTEDRIHKWGIDPKTRVLSWGTLDAADEDEAKN
jgi:hypothetical protein